MSNPHNDSIKKYRTIFLMNIDTNILSEVLVNLVQTHINKVSLHDHGGSTAGMHRLFYIWKSLNIINHMSIIKAKCA